MKDKRVLVVGLGRFGTSLCHALWEVGAETIVIDESASPVDKVKDQVTHAAVGDGTDPRVLDALGVALVDVAVVTFGHDFESSVLAVAALAKAAVPLIIARAETRRKADVLRAVGASRVLEIEWEMGRRLAQDLVSPVASDLLDLAETYRVTPWLAQGRLIGKTLADSGLRATFKLNAIGVRPKNDERTRVQLAQPDYVIAEGDTLLLVGEQADVRRFFQSAGDS
jgi:trk system potassium uptake protein TrkA